MFFNGMFYFGFKESGWAGFFNGSACCLPATVKIVIIQQIVRFPIIDQTSFAQLYIFFFATQHLSRDYFTWGFSQSNSELWHCCFNMWICTYCFIGKIYGCQKQLLIKEHRGGSIIKGGMYCIYCMCSFKCKIREHILTKTRFRFEEYVCT